MGLEQYRELGEHVVVGDDRVFVVDTPAAETDAGPPLLVIHGFPTSSIDWWPVLPALSARRRVVLFDLPGFGLSDKPDRPYSIASATDAVSGLVELLGLREFDLATHDMGDTVGGELLARQLEGDLLATVRRRVITNGSIYLELAQLTAGQQVLWAAPDEALAEDMAPTADMLAFSLAATLAPAGSPVSRPDPADLAAAAEAIVHGGGNRLLPRLIRYLSDRRDNEARFTGAIESHPSPLGIVWGDLDPIAVVAMAHRLAERRRAAAVPAGLEILEGVGHYPMVEAPDAFAAAMLAALDG